MPSTPPDWAAARTEMMLDPNVTMLNTGSFGPMPRAVFERVTGLRRQLAEGPTNFFVRTAPPLHWESRERTAAFLGTVPQRLVFTANVSSAINLVAAGLTLNAPGEILMSDHEYAAMAWCWERAARRQGLTVRTFPLPTMPRDPGEIVAAAKAAFTSRTRLLFFSHVLSSTGLVLPAKELCREARREGILTVVDGAHAPAMIPLNIDEIAADFYSANLHKWLLAPIGTGILALGRGMEDRLEPLHVSWGYYPGRYPLGEFTAGAFDPDSRDPFGSTARTRFLEFEGTRDICPWLAVPEAIDFQARIGWDAIRHQHSQLAAYTRKRLGTVNGLSLATPEIPGMQGSLTAFECPHGVATGRLRNHLWEHRIEVPVLDRPDRVLLRVSHHFYNTEAEIDRLAEVLRKFH